MLHPFLRSAYERVGHNGRFVALAFIFQLAFGTLDEAYRQSIRQSEFRWLADLGLSFLPLLGYFVLGYHVHDHAQTVVRVVWRRKVQVLALVTWSAMAIFLELYWFFPLPVARYSQTLLGARVLRVLLAAPLSVAASIVMLRWVLERRGTDAVNRLLQTCGLYAYGVYYLHPLVLMFVGWGLTAVAGLDASSAESYVLYLPLGSLVSVFAARQLARLPTSRYLV